MLTITSVLVVASLLGLVFPSTRWLGIGGTALLCVLYPIAAFAVLVIAAALYFFIHFHQRRTDDAIPRLPDSGS
jgi:uncharacterized membrane protein YkvI